MNGSIISLSRQLLRTTALVTLLAGTVAGCNTLTRLSQVGDEPKI
ncbi:MAG TPA: flagellar basal body L-ring protein, partial [Rhodospirillaceae bacterium]|nr:flagellar basal body L-ring protein [Rhodospirillaceae bacterium]